MHRRGLMKIYRPATNTFYPGRASSAHCALSRALARSARSAGHPFDVSSNFEVIESFMESISERRRLRCTGNSPRRESSLELSLSILQVVLFPRNAESKNRYRAIDFNPREGWILI